MHLISAAFSFVLLFRFFLIDPFQITPLSVPLVLAFVNRAKTCFCYRPEPLTRGRRNPLYCEIDVAVVWRGLGLTIGVGCDSVLGYIVAYWALS